MAIFPAGVTAIAQPPAPVAPVAPAAPAAPPVPAAKSSAVDDFGSCLSGQKQGDLLLLIDESGSLQATDPQAARVTAANYLVDKLASYSATAGVKIDVGVSGFSDAFDSTLPWTTVTPQSVGAVHGAIDAFKTRNVGNDTDYWTALDSARALLAQRGPGPEGAHRCQAIAWLTDGELDFTARDGLEKPFAPGLVMKTDNDVRQGVAAATTSICRPGGIADQVRSSGIVIFGVGLESSGASKPANFDSMKSMVTGDPGPGGACGDITSPSPGVFVQAGNIDELLFAFDALGTPGQAPLVRDEGVCQVQVCDSAKHRFVLDDSIGSVDVLGTSETAGLVPVLVGPSGQTVNLPPAGTPPATNTVDGASVASHWESANTITVAMTKSTGLWSGAWALAFVDPTGKSAAARSKTNIHISGNISPTWSNEQSSKLHAGEVSKGLIFGLVDRSQKVVDPAQILGTATLRAELLVDGKPIPTTGEIAKADIGQPYDLDITKVPPGQQILRLTLSITTAPAVGPDGVPQPGTDLTPQTKDIPVAVSLPVGYPTVGTLVDFGTVEGAGNATATLPITGPGCVWIEGNDSATILASPDRVGKVAVSAADATSKDKCVKVEAGQSSTVKLVLATANDAKGAVNGKVKVLTASSEDLDNPKAQSVPFTAELQKPLQQTTFWGALILALIVGPGLPLLLLYAAKWFTARIPALPLVAAEIPVTVEAGSVMRDGASFALRDRDLVDPVQGLSRASRRVTVGSVQLKTHIGWSPFGAGFVTVEGSPLLSASSETPASKGKPPRARLPLAVHNKWLVLHDPAGPENAATVIIMAGGTTTPAQRDEAAEDLVRRLPAVLQDLHSSALEAGSIPPSNGGSPAFGGTSAPGGGSQDPFGAASDPFGQSSDPFGDPFGNPIGNPIGNPAVPSGQPSGSFGSASASASASSGPPPPPPSSPSSYPESTSLDPFGAPNQGSDPWS